MGRRGPRLTRTQLSEQKDTDRPAGVAQPEHLQEKSLRAAIFIDGGYFFNHIQDEGRQLDYDWLAQYLLGPFVGICR